VKKTMANTVATAPESAQVFLFLVTVCLRPSNQTSLPVLIHPGWFYEFVTAAGKRRVPEHR
jgi:hypothetical protein